jgi:hypothetical protein
VNSIEDRLRDAYQSAAETVTPGTIRRLDEQAVTISDPDSQLVRPATRRVLIPLSAAASVALIGLLTAVVVPQFLGAARSHGGHKPSPRPVAASPAGRFLVAVSGRKQQTLTVHNALTGASVATIAAPSHGLYFSDVATGDGEHYVAVLWRPHVCRSWLYQFQLSPSGQPGALTPYALATSNELLNPIAVSKDNSTFAYAGEQCSASSATPQADLAVVTVASQATRSWSIPKQADVSSLSLSAGGRMLAYDVGQTKLYRSAAYVLPASAGPGTAFQRSRVVATGARFGHRAAVSSDVITPDGRWLYFITSGTGSAYTHGWQLRLANLATGRTRIIARYAGFPAALAAGPAVRRALVVDLNVSQPTPSPSAAPSSANATPSPSPTSAGSAPSPSPSRHPSRSGHKEPTPTTVRGGGSGQPTSVLLLISLPGRGSARAFPARVVNSSWNPEESAFAW